MSALQTCSKALGCTARQTPPALLQAKKAATRQITLTLPNQAAGVVLVVQRQPVATWDSRHRVAGLCWEIVIVTSKPTYREAQSGGERARLGAELSAWQLATGPLGGA